MRFAIWVVLIGAAFALGCGKGRGSDPFGPDAGVRAGQGGEGGASGEAGESQGGAAPDLDGPCLDDAQCDDQLDCTLDSCDARFHRCRHDPDDALCEDGVYCNGKETCDTALGCRAGPVVACSDSDTCTIDVCIEKTRTCAHEARDADGDGDPATSCQGRDCNDLDPLISGSSSERCGNAADDDCDGEIDESDCVAPAHDRCGDALVVEEPGSFELTTAGTDRDFSLSCAAEPAFRDVVLALVVPPGEVRDIDVVASAESGAVALAATDQCGDASAETDCALGPERPEETSVARLFLRAVEPGAHALYLATKQETSVLVHVGFRDPTPAPDNLSCATALELAPGVPKRAVLAVASDIPETSCGAETGALYYSFELDAPRDVHLRAAALDDFGLPVVSLRDAACVERASELGCRANNPSDLFVRALPRGSYTVALSGTGPSEVELVLSLGDPSEPPATEGCSAPPPLVEGVTELVELGDHTDAVRIGCLVGAVDASFELLAPEPSDVLLVGAGSDGDTAAVLVAEAPCADAADALACQSAERFPVRTIAHRVPAGALRAVVETGSGTPASVTAFRRPAANTVVVPRADECADTVAIPEQGGRFEGTTANAYADYSASCDYGGQPPGGAPDQLLHLELGEARRVIFDMQGSTYDTLLLVRNDDGCPGSEVLGTCAVGYVAARSFLDVTLAAGSYNVQIDGYNGANGKWVLEVFTAEP